MSVYILMVEGGQIFQLSKKKIFSYLQMARFNTAASCWGPLWSSVCCCAVIVIFFPFPSVHLLLSENNAAVW